MCHAGALIFNACFIKRWVYIHGGLILPEYFLEIEFCELHVLISYL